MSATAATHGLAALLIAASCGGGGKSTIDARSDAGGIDAPIVDAPATDTRVTDAPATTDTPIDTPTTDAPTIDMPVPPASCFDNWKTVYLSAPNELVPGQDDLSWRDGTLYVGHSSTQYAWVFSVPDHGGDKNLLYEGHLRSYWVENDRLLYAQNYDLFDMPRAGGPPTKVLHYGDKYYDTSGGDSVVARNLDSTAIYWLFPYTSGLMLWRHLRSGGEDTMLATVPASDSSRPISWLRQAKGQLVLSLGQASLTGLPYAATVPKTGGALLPLPIYGPYSSLLAASKDGALLWSRNDTLPSNNGLPPPVVYSFARADIDGTPPAAFPTTIPQDATPVAAWAAGSRAWYVATSEVDAVGMAYLSIWYLPANGAAFRVGCDSVLGPPDAGKANPSKLTAGLAADGAFYASVQRQDGHWMVARADNTGAHADTGDPGSAGGASGAGGAGGTGGAAGTGGGGANCPSLPSTGGFGGSGPVLTEFLIPGASSNPMSIAPGPDGTLWFGESARGRIGRITTEGCISELPNGGFASDIVVGPDNYAWFTSGMFIGRMLSDGSLLRLFKLSPASSPSNLTFGPDGNVWFPSTGQPSAIVRLTPAGKITMFTTTFSLTNPRGAVAAPDGNIWFSETNYGSVARVNPTTGVITEVKIPNGGTPGAIELGPDGNLWVISSRGSTPILLRVTTSDVFTEFPLAAGASPSAMCAGPDGNLWVTEPGRNSIARLEPATGTVTEYMLPTINPGLFAITTGPDRNIWFVEASANRIGRLRF